jgi:hypothetical protein
MAANDLLVLLNCLRSSQELSGYGLIIFSLGCFLIVSMLLWYARKISTGQKTILNNFNETPFYQSKDVLLQERTLESTLQHIPIKTTASVFTKTIIAILVFAVFFTPLHELLNTGYFI